MSEKKNSSHWPHPALFDSPLSELRAASTYSRYNFGRLSLFLPNLLVCFLRQGLVSSFSPTWFSLSMFLVHLFFMRTAISLERWSSTQKMVGIVLLSRSERFMPFPIGLCFCASISCHLGGCLITIRHFRDRMHASSLVYHLLSAYYWMIRSRNLALFLHELF